MTVAALSSAGFSQYISATSNVSASQQAWQSLQQSLAEGNLTAAQSAFKTYNRLNPAPATTSSSTSSTSDPSQLTTDMTGLGSALSSGNLSTARSAFATVQGDLKTTPSQAIANAESAAAQTVQWIDDLLSLFNLTGSTAAQTTADPYTSMLASAYGLNYDSNTINPMVALLESKYGYGSTANANTAASTISPISSIGNAGSNASVNAYA
jgi:hypothetical protein